MRWTCHDESKRKSLSHHGLYRIRPMIAGFAFDPLYLVSYNPGMEARERNLQEYITRTGRNPFGEWLQSITDKATRARIRTRLSRLRLGNFGDSRGVGEGVNELRLDFGPGYRVYYGLVGDTIVLLLGGGTKRTQVRDIQAAKRYWQEFQEEHAHERL
jgi:putative addiction module killer protein